MAARLLDITTVGRQRIDRYELIGEIASGGMATVFLARLTGLGGFQRFVALKRLHPHLATDREFVRMFLDEARLAAGIHHPNVVPILEVGAGESGYYLVMEYVEGETLARLLARAASSGGRLPVPIAVRIGLDMLSGLHAAHELRDESGAPTNLVHRDVSPQNVLVGTDGIGRITDFGVAHAASRLGDTRAGQLKGKIAYMAPEQAAGVEDIDRRADIFACGIVIWEALAQRRLFKAQNEAATLSRVMNEPVPALARVTRGVPPELDRVVMRALERDPEKRFATCLEFADALEAAAEPAGQVASSKELAAYAAETLGEEIAQQRDAVRAWIAQSEASGTRAEPVSSPISSVSATNHSLVAELSQAQLSTTQLEGRTQQGRSRAWLAILALLGVAGVGAALLLLKNQEVTAPPAVEVIEDGAQPDKPMTATQPVPSPETSPTASAAEPKPESIDLEQVAAEPSQDQEQDKAESDDPRARKRPRATKRQSKKKKVIGSNPYEY